MKTPVDTDSSPPPGTPGKLDGRNIILAVCGGIAAHRAVDLCSGMRQAGAQTRVAMTHSASRFITPLTFEAISGAPARSALFDSADAWEMNHIRDARWADLIVVAPATANTIAKMARGLGDCPVTALYLAYEGPVLVAPAMNWAMYAHPATQDNIAILQQRGVEFIGPGDGPLACGETGTGRLAEVEGILGAVARLLNRSASLRGKRALVTAGPTREHLDPARFFSNPSSGKMGFALAREAANRGAEVTLITGPSALPDPSGMACIRVESTAEMFAAVRERFAGQDLSIFAAAPADYRPVSRSEAKQAKPDAPISLDMEPTEDIAAWAGQNRKSGQSLVCFAAETNGGEERAFEKLKRKNADFIVVNDISRADIGFASAENEAVILDARGGRHPIAKASKEIVASAILDFVCGAGPATDSTGKGDNGA